jgi:hypothetical protein
MRNGISPVTAVEVDGRSYSRTRVRRRLLERALPSFRAWLTANFGPSKEMPNGGTKDPIRPVPSIPQQGGMTYPLLVRKRRRLVLLAPAGA